MNDDETYREKFITFLEGLEMQNVSDFIELSKEDIKVTAVILRIIIDNSKSRDIFKDLERLDSLFNSNVN